MRDNQFQRFGNRSASALSRGAALACAACVGSLAGLSACTPYARYPEVVGDTAVRDPNIAPTPLVMTVALRRVAARHLGADSYAIELPYAVDEDRIRRIASELGPGVYVDWEAPEGTPVLAVRSVLVLGDSATVDIERPVGGGVETQFLSVRLRSDVLGWRVIGVRSWPVGLDITQTIPPFAGEGADASEPDSDSDWGADADAGAPE